MKRLRPSRVALICLAWLALGQYAWCHQDDIEASYLKPPFMPTTSFEVSLPCVGVVSEDASRIDPQRAGSSSGAGGGGAGWDTGCPTVECIGVVWTLGDPETGS